MNENQRYQAAVQSKMGNQKEGKRLAREMMSVLNRMSSRKDVEDGFIREVTNDHRTLQQLAGNLMVRTMAKWAEDADRNAYDGRNETLVKFCQKIRDENPNVFESGFPFI